MNPQHLSASVIHSSMDTPPDRLSALLERFRVQAALFHYGPL